MKGEGTCRVWHRRRDLAGQTVPDIAAPPDAWDVETDVLVIGGGAAGLIAGLRALEAGAEALVIEREATLSGSTAMSSGFVPAPATRWQHDHGIDDSPDRLAADIQKKAAGGAHPGIVTQGGVASTLRAAHVRDFHTNVLSDGCASFSEDLHDTSIRDLSAISDVMSCNEALQWIG